MLIEILRETAETLENRGITPTAGAGELLSESRLSELERTHGIVLPSELRCIYTTIGDGLHFSWEQGEAFGVLDLPSAEDVLISTKRFRISVAEFADDPRSMDMCVEPTHRPRAFQIWNSMRSWIRFHDEPNGDGFCIRTDGAVVFDQHDWFDGFGEIATTNGLLAGTSFTEFVRSWSRFYFTCPTAYCWGLFEKRGSIDWDPSMFAPEYTRASNGAH